MVEIRKCQKCAEYTMQDEHCGEVTMSTNPPKFSLDDKYGEYRRKVKRELWQKKKLL